ncbi:preprotein translocase subunit SecE [Pseudogracilibacillus auburnensis]|uniref:Protein translocase subunit SecE n=1 Tax=Pseudogracilibacillus auburnensis TaxID=1494959 RepID=A0A2V3VVW8_9BACI|nr:preprotein translocase subunit SecE [Pseudogracilibacillus auburnensis]MBO1005166.1 preprotein translocase subunit SecE [Pseudogracilibacillus auburnensis]PXW84898.1 protein translocase subunit secE/sec61 gamma [Pseudogracilibacillus auburnensis]
MNIFKFLKDVSREMKKVTWPRGSELVSYTITVVVTVAFVAVFFAVIDIGITQILNNVPFLNN